MQDFITVDKLPDMFSGLLRRKGEQGKPPAKADAGKAASAQSPSSTTSPLQGVREGDMTLQVARGEVPNLIQYLSAGQQTGRLSFHSEDGVVVGCIYLLDGQIYCVRYGDHAGIDAMAWMIRRLGSVQAVFTKDDTVSEQNVSTTTQNLMVEAVVRADELVPDVAGAEFHLPASTDHPSSTGDAAALPAEGSPPPIRRHLLAWGAGGVAAALVTAGAAWLFLLHPGDGTGRFRPPPRAAVPAARTAVPDRPLRSLLVRGAPGMPNAKLTEAEVVFFCRLEAVADRRASFAVMEEKGEDVMMHWGGLEWAAAIRAMGEAGELEGAGKWAAAADRWHCARGLADRAAALAGERITAAFQAQQMAARQFQMENKWAAAEHAFAEALAIPGCGSNPAARHGLTRSRYEQAMAAAGAAAAAGDWNATQGFAVRAVELMPESVQARDLLVTAQAELAPRLALHVLTGGRDGGAAEVTLDGVRQLMKLPATIPLEKLGRHTLHIELPVETDRCYAPYDGEFFMKKPGLMRVEVRMEPLALPTAGLTWVVAGGGIVLKPVNAGRFVMGSQGKKLDERPPHTVVFRKPFWMGRTEVTNGQYRWFVKESGYQGGDNPGALYLQHFNARNRSGMPPDDEFPVCYVSWNHASAFCDWLTGREKAAGRLPDGYEYRLPTEAEWEYACRAGTDGDFAGTVADMSWHDLTVPARRNQAVAQRLPNAWGLHDMHGNVWEWCRDWLGDYQNAEVVEPTGPARGMFKVIRGGSWENGAELCRSANRGSLAAPECGPNTGFRIVLGVVPAKNGRP